MKLKSFNYLAGLLIILFCSQLTSEEKIDIWNNNKPANETSSNDRKKESLQDAKTNSSQTIDALQKIQIQQSAEFLTEEQNVYGIYEPANYDLSLNMWSTTKAEDLRSSLKRLKKIELSKFSNEILENILLSFS